MSFKSVHFYDINHKGIEEIEFRTLNCIVSNNEIVVFIKILILRAYGTLKRINYAA